MKEICRFLFFLLLMTSCSDNNEIITPPVTPETNTVLAFPGAQGAGRFAEGGRGGKIIYVTNLNDGGPGSLRDAVNQTYKRTIVFAVSGTIDLLTPLVIGNPYVTIAGQTAPGDGITIRNWTTKVKADHVVIRFVRFRMGDLAISDAADALEGQGQKNVIIDHCSMSWSVDECSSFYDNKNFTMQWCILSESLKNSVHNKGSHGFGGIWGGKNASFHHNLLAHHSSRNPRYCGSRYSNQPDLEKVEFVNNVLYNWGYNSSYAAEGGAYNIINNYYKSGPATDSDVKKRIIQPYPDSGDNNQPAGIWGKFYISGNYIFDSSTVTADNWNGGVQPSGTVSLAELRIDSPVAVSNSISLQTAEDAYNSVLLYAGASYVRDTIDRRIIREVKNRTYTYTGSNGSTGGIIDSQADVGGWPVLNSTPAPLDTDQDGIPDNWEDANGLEKNNAADGNKKTLDPNGEYTNVELYLNGLVNHLYSN